MYAAWQEAAKGNYDFYLWLNDDTYLKKDNIDKFAIALETNNNKLEAIEEDVKVIKQKVGV